MNSSHMITIGANELAILLVPKGCMRKRRTRIAQDTPTIVAFVIFSSTTFSLQIAVIRH